MCEHKWVSGSDLNGCGQCQGEYGPVDAVLITSPVETPQDGDVCLQCSQIFGQPDGTLHQGLKYFRRVQQSYSE